MRITGRLAASTVAAGMVAVMILAAGPAARAASFGSAKSAGSAKAASPVGVQAPWAELANEATGEDLWSRSSVTERPMGSITKVMTAYVVIEAGHLNRLITVPSGIIGYDAAYDASTAGLVPGEKLTALQLLYALLLPSGCDAAYTLASAYGHGHPAEFIAEMNAMARRLRLSKTHFSDFSGLPDPTEYSTYSTARDLVSLGRDAMRLPLFREIVATRTYRLAADQRPPSVRLDEPQPAARALRRRDRDQDRVHRRGRRLPAVLRRARRPGADRRGARFIVVPSRAGRCGLRRGDHARLGVRPTAGCRRMSRSYLGVSAIPWE